MNAQEAWDNACKLILGMHYEGTMTNNDLFNYEAYEIKIGELFITAYCTARSPDGMYRVWANKNGRNVFRGGEKACMVGITLEEAMIQAVLELKKLGLFPEE